MSDSNTQEIAEILESLDHDIMCESIHECEDKADWMIVPKYGFIERRSIDHQYICDFHLRVWEAAFGYIRVGRATVYPLNKT